MCLKGGGVELVISRVEVRVNFLFLTDGYALVAFAGSVILVDWLLLFPSRFFVYIIWTQHR